jgi:magnesium-protoporphyrin O-methyltransferase
VLFTSAPWNPALGAMHFIGRMIPNRNHRAPAIVPIHIDRLMRQLDEELAPTGWQTAATQRVKSGFYISQAIQLKK